MEVSRIIIWITAIVFITQPCFAKSIDGIAFEDTYREQDTTMTLQGLGRKKFMFSNVFVAGLYLDSEVSSNEVLEDVSKRIEISYFHNVAAERFTAFITKRMKKSMSKAEFENVETRLEQMGKYFVDLKPGDLFSMTYIPNIGTKFEFNDQLLGVIEGADFGKGIFSTWVGEKPFDRKVKQQVLGLVQID